MKKEKKRERGRRKNMKIGVLENINQEPQGIPELCQDIDPEESSDDPCENCLSACDSWIQYTDPCRKNEE